jgi:hypothetical protein
MRAASRVWLAGVALAAVACERLSRAPSPMEYDWPEVLEWAWREEGSPGFALRLERRNDEYLARGADSLPYLVRFGGRGALERVVPYCDTAQPGCLAARPALLRVRLRRAVPVLPVWPAPRGASWADTVLLDDSRWGGGTGRQITFYRSERDSAAGGRSYWVISWRALVEEQGAPAAILEGWVLVDKQMLLPVSAEWEPVAGEAPRGGARLIAPAAPPQRTGG